jgi:hypothetical protein
MCSPRLPGFVADVSLGAPRGRYWSPAPALAGAGGGAGPAVLLQARNIGLGGFGGVGGKRQGFWCEVGCNVAYAACMAACGTTGPAAVACFLACSILYQGCNDGC